MPVTRKELDSSQIGPREPLHKALLAEVPHPLIWSKFGNTRAQLTSGNTLSKRLCSLKRRFQRATPPFACQALSCRSVYNFWQVYCFGKC